MRLLSAISAPLACLLIAAAATGLALTAGGGTPEAATQAAPATAGSIASRIAEAAPGSTIEIGPGVYREHLRIDKPLRLIGRGMPVIDGTGSGDIIEIAAAGVEFTGFVVRDTGIDLDKENCAIRVLASNTTIQDCVLDDILFGIDLKSAPDSVLRNNRIGGKKLDVARRGDGIRLWRSDRCLVEGNTIHDGRDAILWYSSGVTVRGNHAFGCRYGFHLMYSDNVTIEDNDLSHNSVGVYLMYSKQVSIARNRFCSNRGPSGYGIGLKETDQYRIEDNILAANRVGVYLDGSPFTTARPGEFFRNTIAYNDIGFAFLPAVKGNVLSENNFIDNVEQVSVQGRGELSGNSFSLNDRGNFWSDYVGYDEDADGVGDYVHESRHLFENLLDREPKLRILLFSPAQQAVEFVARALPAVQPEPKFFDDSPLMRPVASHAVAQPASRAGGLAVAGAGLAGLGLCVVLVACPARSRRNGGAS